MRLSNFWAPNIPAASRVKLDSPTLMEDLSLIRKATSGSFALLPLGAIVLERMKSVVRRQMIAAGAQEAVFATLAPQALWAESGRWESFGPALIKAQLGRKQVCFNPTHEEVAVAMVRGHLRSFRQLPLNFFCIQKVYRDEPRPKSELLRTAEFVMADSYSFDRDLTSALETFEIMKGAYSQIVNEFGLEHTLIEADNGAIGGSRSVELQYEHPLGESRFVRCDQCAFASDADLLQVGTDRCPCCGAPIAARRGIEIAHVFLLEDQYSASMNLKFRDNDNTEKAPSMGCTGIGLTRSLQAVVLRHFDNGKIKWPRQLRPFEVAVVGRHEPAIAERLYLNLSNRGCSPLLDDRHVTVPAQQEALRFFNPATLIQVKDSTVLLCENISHGGTDEVAFDRIDEYIASTTI